MRGSAAQVSLPKLPVATILPAADLLGLAEPKPGTVKFTLLNRLKKLGAELNFRSLVDREVFESRHINIGEAWIRQDISGRVAECAGGIGYKKRGVEVLIHHLSGRSVGAMVWRGMASGDVDANASPKKHDKKIHKVVQKIFHSYPRE